MQKTGGVTLLDIYPNLDKLVKGSTKLGKLMKKFTKIAQLAQKSDKYFSKADRSECSPLPPVLKKIY